MDASGWDERYAATELVWSVEPNVFVVEEVTQLVQAGHMPPSSRVLDLAGGEGRNAIWLAAQSCDVELVEFSMVAIEKAQVVAAQRGVAITTTVADVTALPDLEPADFVLVCYLQLPKLQLAKVLGHAASLVRDGGFLLVIAHEHDNLQRGYGGPQNPENLPTVDQVVAAIGGRLTIERAEQAIRVVNTDDGQRDAIDLIVRGRKESQPG